MSALGITVKQEPMPPSGIPEAPPTRCLPLIGCPDGDRAGFVHLVNILYYCYFILRMLVTHEELRLDPCCSNLPDLPQVTVWPLGDAAGWILTDGILRMKDLSADINHVLKVKQVSGTIRNFLTLYHKAMQETVSLLEYLCSPETKQAYWYDLPPLPRLAVADRSVDQLQADIQGIAVHHQHYRQYIGPDYSRCKFPPLILESSREWPVHISDILYTFVPWLATVHPLNLQ